MSIPGATDITSHLVVSDAAASADWYETVLGATRISDDCGTSVVMKLLGTWLLLTTGGEGGDDKPGVTFAPPQDPATVSAQMIFRVDDANAAYADLKAKGADFLAPPVSYGTSETRAFFRDPDGHLFDISGLHG